MTEQPQPPNQPPAPDGYGHLPGPPQPSYGPPPQGPNPYAQPQPPTAPTGQPAYSFPQPGATPGPGTPPGRRRTTAIAAVAVAGVLVLGVGGYALLAGGGEKDPATPVAQSSPPTDAQASATPDKGDGNGNGSQISEDLNAGRKQGEDRVLWLKTPKIDGPGMGVDTEGQWVVGDTVVKRVWNNLTAYASADGKEQWTLPFPAPICSVTPQTTADAKTVVVYKESGSDSAQCTRMRMVDLKTGKEGWSKEIPKEGLFDIMTSPTLGMAGDTVAVSRSGSASAFRISTGEKLFGSGSAEGCKPSAYTAHGNKVIAIAGCSEKDGKAEVSDADPVTGKKTWTYQLPDGYKVTNVYSLDPVVLDLRNEAKNERAIVVLGPDGKLRTTLSGEGKFANECNHAPLGSFEVCRTSAVDGGTLYLPTAAESGKANEIVAFDLGTGKPKWRTPAGDGRTLTPIRVENGQLIAYRSAEKDKGGEVVAVPVAGGAPTVLLRHPSGAAAPIEGSFYSPQIDYAGGRFYISVVHLRAQDKDEKLLMVFGK
ncbi:outer membrane protein assembly factor BamB family protein [Streptomyces sp. NPDC004244]|uniref:outer membrane protein assembly factor BamB family protein n=1 Tax=Streptomyces sp. NPDC101206 TaxID=3366128 RepID=UPI00380D6AC9